MNSPRGLRCLLDTAFLAPQAMSTTMEALSEMYNVEDSRMVSGLSREKLLALRD